MGHYPVAVTLPEAKFSGQVEEGGASNLKAAIAASPRAGAFFLFFLFWPSR